MMTHYILQTDPGSTVTSVRACEPRILGSSPDICWPLFFGITNEWPKITQIAAIYCLQMGFAMLYAFEV